MDNIVPTSLQRLRPADIMQAAGLAEAALGQEYSRVGVIHSTKRRGTSLCGVIDISPHMQSITSMLEFQQDTASYDASAIQTFTVEVDVKSPSALTTSCTCQKRASLCAHGATLLYHWVTKPHTFETISANEDAPAPKKSPSLTVAKETQPSIQGSIIVNYHADLLNIISQLGLSELRTIAREYELAHSGFSKQQLAEAILSCLKQPEHVRRVATSLEKSQRQLLAALSLAGGFVSDEDLRGIFERFSLGEANQLQRVLLALQSKALLFRANMTGVDAANKLGLGGTLLDITWYVPTEVRVALHVTVPITPAQVEAEIPSTPPFHFLDDLLLIARALDGFRLGPEDKWPSKITTTRAQDAGATLRSLHGNVGEGVMNISEPSDMPSDSLLAALQSVVARPLAFLRFAVHILQLSGIVFSDHSGLPYLRILPQAAQLLLDGDRDRVLQDLFQLWLKQSSYYDLFVLQETGLRFCCRSTALQVPLLRPGELDAENQSARQTLLALLAQTSSAQWIHFQAFARFVYRLNPQFLQRRQKLYTAPHWWIEYEPRKALKPMQWADWARAEMQYLAYLLKGPLSWWGMCDVSFNEHEQVSAFRLTPLASLLLSDESTNTTEPVSFIPSDLPPYAPIDAVEVVSNNEVLVKCSVRAWPYISLLEHFAQPAGARFDYLCYHLTPATLSRALSQGQKAEPLLSLFRTLASHEKQRNGSATQLFERLEQWVSGYGRVRLYTDVTLLETIDSAVMRELSVTTSLNNNIVRTLQPNLHVLKPGGSSDIIDELKHRGQAPLLHREDHYGTD